MTDNDPEEVATAPLGVWIALFLIAGVSFWCQATVTEERFVPALNVISNKFNIPDDIAGATLMAAGASSPELFSSIVALFITHSSLGLGTVFGSEIFNQLIICAGAVYSSRTGELQLDRAIVTREVFFYALGIVALYFALQDVRPVESDPTGIDHIFINFDDGVMVFAGYILYVIVCANMDAVVAFFTFGGGSSSSDDVQALTNGKTDYGSTSIAHENITLTEGMPFLAEKSVLREPKGNFQTVSMLRTKTGDASIARHEDGRTSGGAFGNKPSFIEQSIRNAVGGAFSDGKSVRMFNFILNTEKPSDEHGLTEVDDNEFEEKFSCFMWQRSYFYNKARLATHGWHLRWFSITPDKMVSVPDKADFARHQIFYPAFTKIRVDDSRHIIKVLNPAEGRDFLLMAPSEEIYKAIIEKLKVLMANNEKKGIDVFADAAASADVEHEEHMESLIAFPVGASSLEIFFFFFLFPVRALMHFTVPDVRTLDKNGIPNATLGNAFLAIIMCLVWLIVGSYAMVSSLENLADLMNIPTAVVGYTVSAAGTSLPNYVASAVAARNGFGNQAVSNALGSNTFNIMIGLGLPWALYTSFGLDFGEYNELRNEGITEGVVILAAVLAVLVLLLLQSGFVLKMWHGHLFMVMYVAYLAYVIIPVYL